MDSQSIQLLCAGDLHLGRHPTRIPDRLDGPTFSPREVWQDITQEAIERDVDAVVLSGDIADRENQYFEAYGAFEAGVIELDEGGIPVIVVAGNHDSEFLPRMVEDIGRDNLHLLGADGTWERWTLGEDSSPAVHFEGWSFPRQHVSTSPLDSYDLPEADDAPRVGVLHADLDSPRSQYAPIASSELRNSGVACWLLGHIHVPGIRIEGNPLALYPGSPQALDPGERGAHGPWLVELNSDGTVTSEQIPLGTVCYDEVAVDMSTVEDLQGAGAAISTAIQQFVQEDVATQSLSAFLPRVKLTGRTAAHAELVNGQNRLKDQLASKHGSVDIEIEAVSVDTRPDIDLEARADEDGPVGYLAELLLRLDDGDASGEYSHLVDEAHGALQQAQSAEAYNLLQQESELTTPERAEAVAVLQQEARVLLDTLLQQKEGRQ